MTTTKRLASRFGMATLALTAACQTQPAPGASDDTEARAPSALLNETGTAAQAIVSAQEQAEIAGVTLTLRGCQIELQTTAGTESRTVDLPEPCRFGRQPDGTVQVVQTKQGATALLISSRPRPDAAGECDTRKRAVVVDRSRARISVKEKRSASCVTTGPFDEPLFIVLAASVGGESL
jgi:hypothetical protein